VKNSSFSAGPRCGPAMTSLVQGSDLLTNRAKHDRRNDEKRLVGSAILYTSNLTRFPLRPWVVLFRTASVP
jgi:hypothetical protein